MLKREEIWNNANDIVPTDGDRWLPCGTWVTGEGGEEVFNSNLYDSYVLYFCYAHGDLARDMGYDCIALRSDIQISTEDEGEFELTFAGRKCILFKWHSAIATVSASASADHNNNRGLVVYADVPEDVEYARKAYELRQPII